MYKGFDEIGFMAYLEKSFNGMENSFVRGLIENLIKYGHKYEQVSKDQFVDWLINMIPEISFGEVAAFMEDGCLTAHGQAEKKKALEEMDIR